MSTTTKKAISATVKRALDAEITSVEQKKKIQKTTDTPAVKKVVPSASTSTSKTAATSTIAHKPKAKGATPPPPLEQPVFGDGADDDSDDIPARDVKVNKKKEDVKGAGTIAKGKKKVSKASAKDENGFSLTSVEISVANLNQSHSYSHNHYMVLTVAGKPEIRSFERNGETTQFINLKFADRTGRIIKMEHYYNNPAFDDEGHTWLSRLIEHLSKSKWQFRVEFFGVSVISANDRKYGAGLDEHYKLVYIMNPEAKVKEDQHTIVFELKGTKFAPPRIPLLKDLSALVDVATLALENPSTPLNWKGLKSVLLSFVGVVVCHSEVTSGESLKGKTWIKSSLIVIDDSAHKITITLWGPSFNQQRYAEGSVVLFEKLEVVRPEKDQQTLWGFQTADSCCITLISVDLAKQHTNNLRVMEMYRWNTENAQEMGDTFKDLSAPSTGADAQFAVGEQMTLAQLLSLQEEALSLVRYVKEDGRMESDEKTKRDRLPKEVFQQLKHKTGYIDVVVEITDVHCIQNAARAAPARKAGKADIPEVKDTLLTPICSNEKHATGYFVPAVKWKDGHWECMDPTCRALSATCSYRANAMVSLADNTSLSLLDVPCYQLSQVLDWARKDRDGALLLDAEFDESNLLHLLLETRNKEDNVPSTEPAEPNDHTTYDAGVLSTVKYVLCDYARPCCATIQIKPDAVKGLSLSLVRVSSVDNERQIAWLQQQIEDQFNAVAK